MAQASPAKTNANKLSQSGLAVAYYAVVIGKSFAQGEKDVIHQIDTDGQA